MKKILEKGSDAEDDPEDEIHLLAKFAERLDKQNEVLKKLLEEKGPPKDK